MLLHRHTPARLGLVGLFGLVFLAVLCAGTRPAQAASACGTLKRSTTWSGDVTLSCPVTVPRNITLTVAPDARVYLRSPLVVQGTLNATSATFKRSGGVRIDVAARATFSSVKFWSSALELRGTATATSQVTVTSSRFIRSKLLAGAAARPTGATLRVSTTTFSSSPVALTLVRPSRIEDSTFRDASVKIAGGTPVVQRNTFSNAALTVGDTASNAALTDTAQISQNSHTGTSPVALRRVHLGGTFATGTLTTDGVVTVPANRTVAIAGTSITATAPWVVQGTLSVTDGAFTGPGVTLGASRTTDPSAQLLLERATFSAPVTLNTAASLTASSSTLHAAPITAAAASALPLRPSDHVTIRSSTLRSSPINLKRTALGRIQPFDIAVTVEDSSFDASVLDVWSTNTVAIARNAVSNAAVRIAGGTPVVVANSFSTAPLTIGDTESFTLVTDLAQVRENTASPATVVLGRSILGGSFTGLALHTPNANATLTLPASHSFVTTAPITGSGTLVVHGSFSSANAAVSLPRTVVGAASTTAPSASFALTGSLLNTDLSVSGGSQVSFTNATLHTAAIRPAAAPWAAPRSADAVSIDASTLTDVAVTVSRTASPYPLAVSLTGSSLSQSRVELHTTSPVLVRGSTFSASTLRALGGSPVITENLFTSQSTVSLGDLARYPVSQTNLRYLAANHTDASSNATLVLGHVSLSPETDFTGFTGLAIPDAWTRVSVPQGAEIELRGLTVTGAGTLQIQGTVRTYDTTLRQSGTFVAAASNAAPSARLEMHGGTLASAVVLDSGAALETDATTIAGTSLRHTTAPVITPRAGDGVTLSGGTLSDTVVELRRFTPEPVSTFAFAIVDVDVARSSIAVWSDGDVDVTDSTFHTATLHLIGGAPTVRANTFTHSGALTLGDTTTATQRTTDLSHVSQNTVVAPATAELQTLRLGRVELGGFTHDGTLGFSTLRTSQREVSANATADATIADVTITGPGPWRASGVVAFDTVRLERQVLDTVTQGADVTLIGSILDAGTLTAGHGGRIELHTTAATTTRLNAGSAPLTTPLPRASTPGRITITGSTLTAVTVVAQERSTLGLADATLVDSPVSTLQDTAITLTSATLVRSPLSLVKSSLNAASSRLEASAVRATGGAVTVSAGTTVVVAPDAIGVSVQTGTITVAGSAVSPVVFTGVCDPVAVTPPAACATAAATQRPRAAVALTDGSELRVSDAVFALARTALSLDHTTRGAAPAELTSSVRAVTRTDFVATDDAVTYNPNWSVQACRHDAYLPLVDVHFAGGHAWRTWVSPSAIGGMRSYLGGTSDYSGMLRGQVASAHTPGAWLARVTADPALDTWSPPVTSSTTRGGLVLQSVLDPSSLVAQPHAPHQNLLPYTVQLCQLAVPTTPAPSHLGIPVGMPRLTTPATPMSSSTGDLDVDGRERANHTHTDALVAALALPAERTTTVLEHSPLHFLALPQSELERAHQEGYRNFTPETPAAVEGLTISRSRENDPLLAMRWGTPPSARVFGYHIEVSTNGGPFQRVTPTMGIPGRFNTMHMLACSFRDDCAVRLVAIGFDGESAPSTPLLRPRSPFAN